MDPPLVFPALGAGVLRYPDAWAWASVINSGILCNCLQNAALRPGLPAGRARRRHALRLWGSTIEGIGTGKRSLAASSRAGLWCDPPR